MLAGTSLEIKETKGYGMKICHTRNNYKHFKIYRPEYIFTPKSPILAVKNTISTLGNLLMPSVRLLFL